MLLVVGHTVVGHTVVATSAIVLYARRGESLLPFAISNRSIGAVLGAIGLPWGFTRRRTVSVNTSEDEQGASCYM